MIIDATLASDYFLHIRKDILGRIQNLIVKIDEKIKDEKLQYDINRETAKLSTLSSGKTGKYITGE